MIWNGETVDQWRKRTLEWHQRVCWLPRQADDGRWVWLETIWVRRKPTNFNGGYFWQCRIGDAPHEDPTISKRPTPPRD